MSTSSTGRVAVGTAAQRPAGGAAGDMWFATDTSVLSVYTGAAWVTVEMGAGGSSSLGLLEAAAPSGVAGQDIIYADSTAHRLKAKNNNGGAVTLATLEQLETFLAGMKHAEVSAPAGASGNCLLWDDSTAHRLKMNNNNGGATNVLGASDITTTLKKGSGAGNYSTASASYVDVDGTNLSYTVTIPTGWKLSVLVSGNATTLTGVAGCAVAIYDSATLVETEAIPQLAGYNVPFSLGWVISGDGASHTVKLQYKTTNVSDSAQIFNSSSTSLPTMVFMLTPSN